MQLDADIVTKVIILPGDLKRTRVIRRGAKRMLAPFAVAQMVHQEH